MMNRTLFCLFLYGVSACASVAQTGFGARLADSAMVLTKQKVAYDPTYYRLDYPNGDVPAGKGVCTDVVIRAYRKLGVDLQVEVHQDMLAEFDHYPQHWGASGPDRNIDHRRVPNLMTFFIRHGKVKTISRNAADYAPGDVVCWSLGNGITHIGIVSGRKEPQGKRYLIVHNIGAGQVAEDVLFAYTIIGHYQYGP